MANVQAQAPGVNYPAKQIRVIVPFPAGGPTDAIARAIGQKLSETWGQPVIVDNRPGAGGNIGTELAAKSPADGYTLFIGTVANAINQSLFAKLPFDFVRDFAPVTQNYVTGLILAVHPSLPAHSVKELIALAKAHPGQLSYSSSGVGGTPHLAGELFNSMAGVTMVHVPYKGSAPAMADLLGGHIQLTFDNMLTVLPQVKAGKLRGLAVTMTTRSPLTPELPTVADAGLKGFEVKSWNGVVVPTGTPKEIIARLNGEIVRILRQPDLREKFLVQGVELVPTTPEEFGAFIKQDIAKWAKVIQLSGARAE
ncbi:MAG TPA: tripartite tricarboxylate transporter substrate binding protein [Burkholderiales bacterium]|nr:tripartite tricarboxylate transporter substrate binding protein [Burkholderiales bacterium]